MLYFTLTLSEEYNYSYEVDEISDDVKNFNTEDTIFYTSENLSKGDIIDFWELSDFDIYSGYVYKILDSHSNTATVIDYDDVYDVNDYLYTTGKTIVRIEHLIYKKKELTDFYERTSEILCDICEVNIPKYS